MKKLILLLLIFSSICSISFAQNTAAADTFPLDFGKTKTYLYVITIPGYFQANNALKKAMEKNYTGEYEVIDVRDFMKGPQKQNSSNYALSMIYDNQEGYFSASGRITPETNYSCGVKDMSTDKLYRLPYVGGNYKKVMDTYIKRLEEIRKSNEAGR